MRFIPDSRRGMLWRFALGAVIIIAFTATTTAVAGLLQFKQFTDYLSLSPVIKNAAVSVADPGNPQTLLLIGSDHRAGEPFSASNTDTMMLVRLDPNSSTINVLSVPRDLKVQIPEGGVMTTDKLNSAYSIGGPNLLLKVLKQQVFPGLHVNHIIDVNFGGFEDLVDAIGCVYTDVDHRYYNNTAYTDYSSIDIQPGYQKLCGTDALEFVRFRHTDNDIVRNARQQDFLRWAKDQFNSSELFNNRDKLIKIFGQHTETDHNLHTVDGLINLFDLVAFSAGHSVKQITFPAIFLPCNSGAPAVAGVAPVGVDAVLRHRQSAGRGQGVPRLHDTDPSVERQRRPPCAQAPLGPGTDRESDGGHDRRGDAGKCDPAHQPARLSTKADRHRLAVLHERDLPGRADRRLLPTCVHDPRSAGQSAHRLPGHAGRQPGAGAVLRRSGDLVAEPTDPQQAHRDGDGRRQAADAVFQWARAVAGSVAHLRGGLLDLQHADRHAQQPADAWDRGVADAGWVARRPESRCSAGRM